MSFLRNLFGKNKVEPKIEQNVEPKIEQYSKPEEEEEISDEIKLSWIEAAENPWGRRILDLRPFTLTMISTSQNQKMAVNAISYGSENGTSFFGQRPVNEKNDRCKYFI